MQGQFPMKRLLLALAATAAMTLVATPAAADPAPTPTPSNDPCTYAVVTGAVACVGYYGGNLLTGTTGSSTTDLTSYINQLLNGPATTSGAGYNPGTYSIDAGTVLGSLSSLSGTAGSPYTYDFSPLQLSGYTIFAAHFGSFPDSTYDTGSSAGKVAPDVTAFWLLNLGGGSTSTVTISDGKGVSNAQILGTGTPAVPEPATWAMMLVGFAGIGASMRRRRRPALAQIA